ncbi:Fic family protein [Teredinibacter turnerae]|uniref:Fic family protein n=1 Tax=Teredinibacter turnerae TaxID=2426 RepID=UPI00037BC884|nr:Fic family protein [Teredinibacter turnerae]
MGSDIEQQNNEIVDILDKYPEGLSRGQISGKIIFSINDKTLQRRLAALVDENRVAKTGERKATRYFSLNASTGNNRGHLKDISAQVFSSISLKTLKFLDIPLHARERVSYNRDFLDSYVPNQSQYVPEKVRKQLYKAGKRFDKALAAGTYAREICQRLLIDLSYNSSRLEGNTYSRLDTQKLVEEGITAEGKVHEETVMIMNHKEAILFLVENAQDIELNSLTIRNLHHLLSQDLLANPGDCGNIRSIEVNIGQSTYKPLNNPHLLKELFELILLKARKIKDSFEQSFFLLVHLSYLQAFEDVNKRTSRLSCNIPFIKENLCPLSFTDVSRDDYTAALLAMYEKNNVEPMLELYAWAYLRSCEQYGVVKKSLGEIDAFRIQYRQQRKEVMGLVVKNGLHGKKAEDYIENFCEQNGIDETAKFTAMTLADLSTLHAGAIIGLGITEAQLEAWLSSKP